MRSRHFLLLALCIGILGGRYHDSTEIHTIEAYEGGSLVGRDIYRINWDGFFDLSVVNGVLTVTPGSSNTALGGSINAAEADDDILDEVQTSVQTIVSPLAIDNGKALELHEVDTAGSNKTSYTQGAIAADRAVVNPGTTTYGRGGWDSNAFTYNGDDPCSGDVCRGGTCSGTVCTLTLNSRIGLATLQETGAQNVDNSAAKEYSSFTLTSGTVRIAASTARAGGTLYIRVAGDVDLDGGTIDLDDRGGEGSTGGSGCAANTVGKAGGMTDGHKGGAAGNKTPAGGTNGGAGENIESVMFPYISTALHLPWYGGSPGVGPSSGQNNVINHIGFSRGASGGGGGGCSSGTCTGTPGNDGHGGGFVFFEVGGDFECTGSPTITVKGENGGNGEGGGGGGSILVVAGTTTTTGNCTFTVTGGTAGAADYDTNNLCAGGGVGGNGVALILSGGPQ